MAGQQPEPEETKGGMRRVQVDPVQTDPVTGRQTVRFTTDVAAMRLYLRLISNGIKNGNESKAMTLAASMLLAVFIFISERFGVEDTVKMITQHVNKFAEIVNKSHEIPDDDKSNH